MFSYTKQQKGISHLKTTALHDVPLSPAVTSRLGTKNKVPVSNHSWQEASERNTQELDHAITPRYIPLWIQQRNFSAFFSAKTETVSGQQGYDGGLTGEPAPPQALLWRKPAYSKYSLRSSARTDATKSTNLRSQHIFSNKLSTWKVNSWVTSVQPERCIRRNLTYLKSWTPTERWCYKNVMDQGNAVRNNSYTINQN
jgi:hypothetical protein